MAEEKSTEVGFGKKVSVSHEGFYVGGSILEIDAGKKTDMVFHLNNGKLLYLLSGSLKVMILKDGIVSSVNVPAGASFYVRPGLVYQMEAVDKAIVIEFANAETFTTDINCVLRGTQPPPAPKPAEAVQAAVDAAKVEETTQQEKAPAVETVAEKTPEPVPAPAQEAPVVKKRQTRKKKGLN